MRTNKYLPYGGSYTTSGSKDTSWKYTGQKYDDVTGLYYYNARYYDPLIGTFTSPDTIIQAPYDPQTLNRYTYCRNNPIIYSDPSGHFFGIDDLIIIAVAVVVGGVKEGTHNFSGRWDWNAAAKGAFDWGATAAAVCGLNALTGFDKWATKTFNIEMVAKLEGTKVASIGNKGWQFLGLTGAFAVAGTGIKSNQPDSDPDAPDGDAINVYASGIDASGQVPDLSSLTDYIRQQADCIAGQRLAKEVAAAFRVAENKVPYPEKVRGVLSVNMVLKTVVGEILLPQPYGPGIVCIAAQYIKHFSVNITGAKDGDINKQYNYNPISIRPKY